MRSDQILFGVIPLKHLFSNSSIAGVTGCFYRFEIAGEEASPCCYMNIKGPVEQVKLFIQFGFPMDF
jgi:hypothetical protein